MNCWFTRIAERTIVSHWDAREIPRKYETPGAQADAQSQSLAEHEREQGE
jgi:hypothetical protein